jgi:hypothetical protein
MTAIRTDIQVGGRRSRRAERVVQGREWARTFWSALTSHHTSVYVNFLMDYGEARIRQAYGADRPDWLKALKRTYDPGTSSG